MNYDYERAKEKEEEIIKFVEEAILIYWKEMGVSGKEKKAINIAKDVTKNFVNVNPPEKAPLRFDLITMNVGGRGGGRSLKTGNIFMNFRKLVSFIASSTLSIISMTTAPWTVPLAAIVLWDRLWSNLTIKLSEREAAIIWTMWLNRDDDDYVEHNSLLEKVNSELKNYGRNSISQQEMDDSLEKLTKIGCIERSEKDPSKWWLCEWVEVNYR